MSRRTTRTTRSISDANALRALVQAWFRSYRPVPVGVLGASAAIESVDQRAHDLLRRAGQKTRIADIRRELRAIARDVEREIIPAYDAAQWSDAAAVPVMAAPQVLIARLERLSPELAVSYQQVQRDLADLQRATYIGPAGEIREVLRTAIHLLAPDDDVRAQDWFDGGTERPHQSERIRYIVRQRSSPDAPSEAAELVEERVGRLGRTLYGRTSKAFHTQVQREELVRIVGYVDAVLNEILPL